LDKSFEILEKLENEANYLFDSVKISAAKYKEKIEQIECLSTELLSQQIFELTVFNDISQLNNELREINKALYFYAQLLGGFPDAYIDNIEAENMSFKGVKKYPKWLCTTNTVKKLEQLVKERFEAKKLENPMREIDISHALRLMEFIEKFDKGINDFKQEIIKKHGPQKAAEMWEKAEQLNKQA
jgi:hypothetical protein